MKAILLIDMPEDMRIEDTKALNVTLFRGMIVWEVKMDCPLKPMPQKKEIHNENGYYDLSQLFYEGWNYCIDEITGEQND